MEANFNQPQRQSPIGILVMFVDSLQKFVKAFWPIILISVFKSDSKAIWYSVGGFAAIVIIVAIFAYLRYINFTFYIDDENDEFIINDGVVNKTRNHHSVE